MSRWNSYRPHFLIIFFFLFFFLLIFNCNFFSSSSSPSRSSGEISIFSDSNCWKGIKNGKERGRGNEKGQSKKKRKEKENPAVGYFFSLLLLSFLLHTHHQICESISWTGDLKTHWNIWKGIEFKDLKEPSWLIAEHGLVLWNLRPPQLQWENSPGVSPSWNNREVHQRKDLWRQPELQNPDQNSSFSRRRQTCGSLSVSRMWRNFPHPLRDGQALEEETRLLICCRDHPSFPQNSRGQVFLFQIFFLSFFFFLLLF